MSRRQLRRLAALAAVVAAAVVLMPAPAVQAQAPAPYTLLSRDARRTLAVRSIGGQDMVSLDELAKLFDLTTREDALAGGLTISTKTQTIALTPGQALASVGGRLVSLPAAPAREGRTWYLPVDFVPRALGPALGIRLELRRPSRLLLVGDVRVPRVTAHIEPVGAQLRLTLDVVPATAHTVTQEGGRLIVKFDAEALDATLPSPPSPDMIQAVRLIEPSAIGVDLGPRFGSFRAADTAGAGGAGRLTLDLMPVTTTTSPASPVTPAAPVAPAPADPPLLDIAPAGGVRTVVIDPGHGGDEPGARGPQGAAEKDVTLAVARRLKAAIETRLGARVILTRDGDRTVDLDERAAVANNNKADLFLSLHANASVRPAASGAEVFYLSLADYGDEVQRAAQGGSETLPVHGGGVRDIDVIPWEMAQARHIQQSSLLAQQVETALRERVPMSARPLQEAPFRVLVGANMPAVLVEMGFITNPAQEKHLTSDAFQSLLVQALVDSIVRFRDQRGTVTAPLPAPGAHD